MTPQPWITSIFCDDIRQELGGKMSAMGVYHGFIGLPEATGNFHKFCVLTLITAKFSPDPVPVQIRFLDGGTDLMPPLTTHVQIDPRIPTKSLDVAPITVPIEMFNFELRAGMSLCVEVTISGEVIRGAVMPVIHVQSQVLTGGTASH